MESAVTSSAQGSADSSRSVDELWLEVLQQIGARTAHELKGALNGVAVNLEVVRSRAARTDAAASAIGPFASSAADQLEAVVDMTDALLTLARAPREPLDLFDTVRAFAALLAPSARADGGSLRLESASRELEGRTVRTHGNVVRLVIAAALLAALASKGDIRCRVEVGDDTTVSIECADAETPLTLEPDVQAVAAAAGVRVQQEGQSFSLIFPRAAAARQRTPERA
jgi:signal transduction histidine kinase